MEVEGTRGLFDAVKSTRTRIVAFVGLWQPLLVPVECILGLFLGPKKPVLGQKMHNCGRARLDLA